MTRTYR